MADILTDAVDSVFKAVSAAMPSQAPLFAVSGVRTDSKGNVRKLKGTVAALVSSTAGGSPLGDFAATTNADAKSLLVRINCNDGWFDETPPQTGDVFEAVDGSKWAVESATSVRDLYFRIEVRKC
jgi:hypothetical protein